VAELGVAQTEDDISHILTLMLPASGLCPSIFTKKSHYLMIFENLQDISYILFFLDVARIWQNFSKIST